MTETPESFAERPGHPGPVDPAEDGDSAARDVLSDLLRSVRLRGEQVFDYRPASAQELTLAHTGGALHIVLDGRIELQLEAEAAPRMYGAGDVVLLPVGGRHVIRAGTSSNGGDVDTHWLSGTFAFDDSRASVLLSGLPRVIELRGLGGQSIAWLDVSCEMLFLELRSPSQGSQVMVSRILDLLFIHVLRSWALQVDAEPGWLPGAMDPLVSEAITAMHDHPEHPWTVAHLAKKSNLSRSAFAERFARRVGQPPAAYLAQLRLAIAAERLVEGDEPVSAVARSVGYDSEAAFSRAFSRRFGAPPSTWRQQGRRRRTTLLAAALPRENYG